MLGMTIACARCHDHKFDPIPTTDYYAIAGIFHSTEAFAGVAPGKRAACDGQLLALADKSNGYKISPEQQRDLAARQQEIATRIKWPNCDKTLRQANRKAQGRPMGNGKGAGRRRSRCRRAGQSKGGSRKDQGAGRPHRRIGRGAPLRRATWRWAFKTPPHQPTATCSCAASSRTRVPRFRVAC